MQIIDEIKSRYDVFSIAQLAGVELRKSSNNLYYSPFREDRKPSFSIFDNGAKFKDYATEERGDCISFYALARNIDNKQAIRELSESVGTSLRDSSFTVKARPTKAPLESSKPKPSPTIPPLMWDDRQASYLSNLRGFNVEALKLAHNAGVFGFCEYKGVDSWIITDKAGLNAQARRRDGKPYFGTTKALTLKNSTCSYPLGLSEIGDKRLLCIAEGSTDFLALWHFAYVFDAERLIAPLAMLGASNNISPQHLKAFAMRRVLIFADADPAGKKALDNWGNALSDVAQSVEYFNYGDAKTKAGEAVKDLCDFMQLDYDYWEQIRPYDNPFYNQLNAGNF